MLAQDVALIDYLMKDYEVVNGMIHKKNSNMDYHFIISQHPKGGTYFVFIREYHGMFETTPWRVFAKYCMGMDVALAKLQTLVGKDGSSRRRKKSMLSIGEINAHRQSESCITKANTA